MDLLTKPLNSGKAEIDIAPTIHKTVVFGMVFTSAGLAVSYTWNLTTGPTIIVIAGAVYLVVAIGATFRRRRAHVARRELKRAD